jgi:hypothetical protein
MAPQQRHEVSDVITYEQADALRHGATLHHVSLKQGTPAVPMR